MRMHEQEFARTMVRDGGRHREAHALAVELPTLQRLPHVGDAALVAGVHFTTAALAIRKLCTDGALEKTGTRRHARHAQTYRLLKKYENYDDRN